MKKLQLLSIALLTSVSAFAQGTWGVDKSHSKIEFAIDHMVISETTGFFGDFAITAKPVSEDWQNADLTLDITAASINTGNESRDGHIKGEDFFNVAKFPSITFKSKSFKKISGKNYKLLGDITMHGVTKPIALDVVYGGTIVDPYKNTRAGFKIKGALNRKDFGLAYSNQLEAGGAVIGDEVRLTGNVELVKVK